MFAFSSSCPSSCKLRPSSSSTPIVTAPQSLPQEEVAVRRRRRAERRRSDAEERHRLEAAPLPPRWTRSRPPVFSCRTASPTPWHVAVAAYGRRDVLCSVLRVNRPTANLGGICGRKVQECLHVWRKENSSTRSGLPSILLFLP
jgi:hypothetical protein